MNRTPRRLLSALLTVSLASAFVSAQQVSVPRVTLTPSLGGVSGAAGLVPGTIGGPASLSLSPMLSLTPALSVMSAPALMTPAAPVAAVPVALSPVSGSPALAGKTDAAAPALRVAPALEALELSAASRGGRDGGRQGGRSGGAMFDGARERAAAPASPYIVNDEGVKINDRAAIYYAEVRRMVELYKGKINLEESLDVMDDAYSDVVAKVSAVEAVAKGRGLSQVNTHLEETLTFVDGVLDDGGKTVAVHTHRVFFHKAKNPKSEIVEGIRRVDGVIKDMESMFARGGKAEQQMGRLDEVELVFDARGYQEIKDHIKRRGAEVTARSKGRISFKYLDELAPLPKTQEEIRAKLNEMAQKYGGENADGLSKIYEGVIYSRYVGLLLELKTVEHYYKKGYKILQSGRELFDENGIYVSELDVVVESPEGKISVVEAKSSRVGLPPEEVLADKVVYKLNTYKKFKAQLDAMIGKPFDAVVFSMDVAIDPNIDRSQALPKDLRKLELMDFLKSKEAALSKEYGFPVSFLFMQSGPEGGNARMGLRKGGSNGGGRSSGRRHGRR
ncbi:MAG: hypothetical protein NDJ72_13460 [Elusimicrobia bacterium]|nr:hypothetical protein [Elusimicrobiota bacterium]